MPIYEFVCEFCGLEEEVIQSYKDEAPICKKDNIAMKRQVSKTMIRKGGGLYSMDSPEPPKLGNLE